MQSPSESSKVEPTTSPQNATAPLDSAERLYALYRTGLLDTPAEATFDRFTSMASRLLRAPVALVSLVDKDRQFFKSAYGLAEPWASQRQTPLSHSFCQHVVATDQPLVVEDARKDELLHDNTAISDLNVVAYLGVPLHSADGHVIGSLCAIEDKQRHWSEEDLQTLQELAEMVMTEIRLREFLTEQQQVQLQLRNNNSLLQGILDKITDAVIITEAEPIDLPGPRIVYVNPAFTQSTGYSAAESIGQTPRFLQGKNSDTFTLNRVYAALKQQQPIQFEITNYRKDGTEFDNDINIMPIVDSSGKATHFVSVQRDITKKKQAEQALRESEANFRSLFETMVQGVVYQDSEGRITNANDAAQGILGLSLDEMQGRKSLDPRWRATRADGSNFPGDEHPAMVALRTGEIQRNMMMFVFNPQLGELRCLRVDAVPQFREGETKPFQVYTLIRDVTEQRRALQTQSYHAELLNNMLDAVIATNSEFRINAWNLGAERLYGWKADEVIGQFARDILQTEIDEEVRSSVIAELQNSGRYRMEVTTYHKEGRQIPVEAITIALTDVDRKISGYLSINRDIAERRQSEEALQKSMETIQEQLSEIETLYATTPIGLAVLDRELRYVRINDYLAANNGFSVEEHLGRTGKELIPNVATQLDQQIRQVIENDEPLINLEVKGDTPAQPGVDRTWLESFYPMHDPNGEVVGINIVVEEITERKRAELALQQSEERFRITFEQAPVGIAHTDLNGKYVRVNNRLCEMLGYEYDELIQKNLHDITHPDDLLASHRQLEQLIDNKETSYTIEKRYLHKNGNYVWVNVTVAHVLNFETQETDYLIRIIEDISERKQFEETLHKLNATLEKRVAIRSRQLETSNTKLLESQTELRQLSQQLMQITEQERKRISREIHDQLGQSLTAIKMEVKGAQRGMATKSATVANRLLAADKLIDETVETVRRIAADLRPGVLDHFGLGPAVEWQMEQFKQRNHIDYKLEIDVDASKITPDMATASFRILQEALTNVVRHAQATQVHVGLTMNDENFVMKVCDNGCGLQENHKQRKSLGVLGMQERAQQLGGTVRLSGEAGAGAVITLTLPLVRLENESEEEQQQ